MRINREALCLALARLAPGWAGRQLRHPVFLIGVARSGTTILADLLGTHPKIANWSELNQLWDKLGYPWDESERQRSPDWIAPVEFVRQWWAETPPAERRAIRGALGVYQYFARKPILLNKSPMHTFRVEQILEMIPEARFVYLVRDGRAVAFSYTEKISGKIKANPEPYRKAGLELTFNDLVLKLAEHWAQAQRQYEKYKAALRPEQLLALRYEDLCAEPRPALNSIFDFVGAVPDGFDWEQTRMLANRNDRWRQALPEAVWRAAERGMAAELACWGYPLS
jgi:Sulfotransferase family